jgi:hypothetical protein
MVIINDIQEAKMHLERFGNFQECIIEDLAFEDFLTTLVVSIINIWTDHGRLKKDVDSNKELVQLKLKGIQNLSIFNNLTPNILHHLDMINWGFNEIAMVEIEKEDRGFMKVSFMWENERKIEITCIGINIVN